MKCNKYCDIDLKKIIIGMKDFLNINEHSLSMILETAHMKEFAKDSIIYYTDECVKNLYYLFHGSVKSYKINKFDNEVIMSLYVNDCAKTSEPPLMNYHCLDGKSFRNLQCIDSCKILCINIKTFKELIKEDINLANNIISRANNIIKEQESIINLNLMMDSKAKIRFLIENKPDIFQSVNKKTIAQMLNISQETLSRALNNKH